ncbi:MULTISPECIES: FecR domain-containing protein [unclassified Sinorhizobium]|uniref:FecR family protein n=1 Tax=unclassified Sinorhizobium TaxID=2613772 RepID=UPI003525390D
MAHSEEAQEKIEAEAAEWVIRLGGEHVTAADRHRFERWLTSDPRHRDAFDFASRTWDELAGLKAIIEPAAPMVPAMPFHAAGNHPVRVKSRYLPTLSLAASLVVAAGLGLFWFGNPLIRMSADYVTAPGEQQSVTLSDGTVVDLGSDSALAVEFDDRERGVELLSGLAYFTAAPKAGSETRPFVVKSSVGTARALGTQFVVDKFDGAVEVTVAEHQVNVEVNGPTQSRDALLSSGQAVRYSSDGVLGKVEERDVDQATSWRRGKLIFNDVPLSKVVAELNRYRRGRIVIARDSLARLHVSGVFDTKDVGNALGRIAAELRVRTASVPPLVTVLY